MTGPDDVKGEGFDIIEHEEPEKERAEPESQEAEQAAEEPGGEDTSREQAAETPEGGAETAGAPTDEQARERLEPPDVYAVLRVSVAQLSAVAWQLMGLQADPITNKVRKDIPQARLAIDSAAALIEKLTPHLEQREAREYQTMLTDLRLNFVKQSGEEESAQ